MVDTWAFSFLSTKDTTREHNIPFEDFQETFDTHMQQVVKAEEYGFDGWSWVEHHFHAASNAPVPHLLIANAAARTKTLKFGVLGSVLPLNQSWRYAEEVAVLDYLTHGRFEPGIVPGAGPTELIKAGISPAEQRARYLSNAAFFKQACANRTVTMQDDFTSVSELTISPPLRPELAERTWVAAMSPDSAVWVAQNSFKLAMGWFKIDMIAQMAGLYRATVEEAGRTFDTSMLGLRRRVFVADSDAEAQDLYESTLDLSRWTVRGFLEAADPKIAAMLTHPDDYAIGSPETVAEKLIEQCKAGGIGRIFAFYDFCEWPDAVKNRSLELIGTKVAPLLKSANIAPPALATAEGLIKVH